MLENRDYMRHQQWSGTPRRFRWSASITLMVAITAAFVLQQINGVYFGLPVNQYLALSADGLRQGFLWQLLTFQFLHGGIWHLLFNLLGIWFFGRVVEEQLGVKHFLWLYFASGMAGGFLQTLVAFSFPAHFGAYVYGASAGVCGVLAAYCLLEPDSTILIFFILPVRARHLLVISIVVALFFTVVPSEPSIAHAAHLGGLLTGLAYMRWGEMFQNTLSRWRPLQGRRRKRELVAAASVRGRPWRHAASEPPADLPSDEFISQEVDPILDKISAHGIQSLTERERRILDAARKKMVKR